MLRPVRQPPARRVRRGALFLFALLLLLRVAAADRVAAQVTDPAGAWTLELVEASPDPESIAIQSARVVFAPDGSYELSVTPGSYLGDIGGSWQGRDAVQLDSSTWQIAIPLGSGGNHNLLVVELYDLDAYGEPSARIKACNGAAGNYMCDNSIPMAAARYSAPSAQPAELPTLPPPDDWNNATLPQAGEGETGGCATYCLNGVSVSSPFCDCAPEEIDTPPDEETLDVIELFGAALAAALGIGGVTLMVRRLRRPRPAPTGGIRVTQQVSTPPEQPETLKVSETFRVFDATGKQFRYERDAQGRWINPETGGELNEAQWQDYNRQVEASRRFVEQERQRQARREGVVDRQYDEMVAQQKQVSTDLHAVQQMQRNLLLNPDRSSLWRGRGEPGDMYTRLEQLRAQLEQGEPVNRQQFDSLRRLYSDQVHGRVLAPEEMPSDMQLTRETLNDVLDNTLREIATQTTSDGSFSWKGLGARMILNVATAGQIEMVLTPVESTYTMRDYVARGGDSVLGGFVSSAKDVVIGELFSLAGEKGAKMLGKLADNYPILKKPLWSNVDEAAEAVGRRGKVKPPQPYRIAPGVDVNPHLAGMPEANVRRAKQIAEQYNVQIMVRPTNPEARKLLESGLAIPKPEMVKNKTINFIDTLLGATADDVGKVGHFHPKLPPRSQVPPELYEKVKSRWLQRWKEFRNQKKYIDDLVANKKVVNRNGVLHEVLPDGSVGRPFTGDHDLFEILDAHGNPCPESLKNHVIKELEKPPFSAQHGPHMDWDYSYKSHTPTAPGADSPWDVAHNIDQTIRNSHAPNGAEPLIQFAPGTRQPVHAAHYIGG